MRIFLAELGNWPLATNYDARWRRSRARAGTVARRINRYLGHGKFWRHDIKGDHIRGWESGVVWDRGPGDLTP